MASDSSGPTSQPPCHGVTTGSSRRVAPHPRLSRSSQYALVDSGSGIVVHPLDSCEDHPLWPAEPTPTLRSADGSILANYGKRMVTYALEDGSASAVAWPVAHVTCPILAVESLVAGGARVEFGPSGGAPRKPSGEHVASVLSRGRPPWLHMRPLTQGSAAGIYLSVAMSIPEWRNDAEKGPSRSPSTP